MNGKNHHRDELCSNDDAEVLLNFSQKAQSLQHRQKSLPTSKGHSFANAAAAEGSTSPSSVVCDTYGTHTTESEDDGSISEQEHDSRHDCSTSSTMSLDETSATAPARGPKKPKVIKLRSDRRQQAFARALQRRKPSHNVDTTTATGLPLALPPKKQKSNDDQRDHGFFQMVLEQPPMTDGITGPLTNTVSSSSSSLNQHSVFDHTDRHDSSTHVTIENGNSMTAMMAKTDSVFFGWIRHPATKTWRDAIKVFSQNHRDYPSWSDEICDKLKTMLREEKGIVNFFLCRRNQNDKSSEEKQKKIFDKQKNYMGQWAPATDQEILDRTKQRFVDDRKPQALVMGAKRPRGRPPKAVSREISLELSVGSEPKSTKAVLMKLHPMLMKCNHDLARLETSDKQEQVLGSSKDGHDSGIKPNSPAVLAPMDPTKLVEVISDLDRTQTLVRKELESALNDARNAAEGNIGGATSKDNNNTGEGGENPAKKPKLSADDVPSRQPWFPVLSNHVCFDWHFHAGTVRWREVVKMFSENVQSYPEWNDKVADLIKVKLAEMGCSVFLVFLDAQGRHCQSIQDGLWYSASDTEFLKYTKQQFLQDRSEQQEVTSNRA